MCVNKEQECPYMVKSLSTLAELTGRFVCIMMCFSIVVS